MFGRNNTFSLATLQLNDLSYVVKLQNILLGLFKSLICVVLLLIYVKFQSKQNENLSIYLYIGIKLTSLNEMSRNKSLQNNCSTIMVDYATWS